MRISRRRPPFPLFEEETGLYEKGGRVSQSVRLERKGGKRKMRRGQETEKFGKKNSQFSQEKALIVLNLPTDERVRRWMKGGGKREVLGEGGEGKRGLEEIAHIAS